jgi:hypothetical protein
MTMLLRRRILLLAAVWILACAADAMSAQDWELLGRREVDYKGDRDTISVGSSKGQFKQLRIVVRGGSIEMHDMVVTFGNDKTFSPDLRHKFNENSSSRVIDLPGEKRNIRRIDFRYRSTDRKQGKATVQVYGR